MLSPSEHLSMKYLRELIDNNFIHPISGKEYPSEEVLDLYYRKLNKRDVTYKKIEKQYFNKFEENAKMVTPNDDRLYDKLKKQSRKPNEATIHPIISRKKKYKFKCNECDFKTNDESLLLISADVIAETPEDSGRYGCPQCLKFIDNTYFDDFIILSDENGFCLNFMWEQLEDIFEYEIDNKTNKFHIGQMIANSFRKSLEKHRPHLFDKIFNDNELAC